MACPSRIALAQEVACDELVSRQRDVSVADYGHLLLELATKYPRTAIPLATVGVVESFHIFFKRRLNAMKYFRTSRTKPWSVHATSWILVGIALVGLLPWRLVAQSVPIVSNPVEEFALTVPSQGPEYPFPYSGKSSESPFEKVKESPFEKVKKSPFEKVVESPFKKVEENPFQKVEESPFEPYKPDKYDGKTSESNQPVKNDQETSESNQPVKNDQETSDDSSRTGNVDWSQSQEVSLVSPDTEWQVAPLAAPAAEYRPKSVALPSKTDFFEGLHGMAVSRVAKMAVVAYGLDRHPAKTTRVVLCDLQTGRATISESTEGLMVPLALHDDGRQILMCRNDFGFGNQDRLEIWTVENKKIVRSLIWTPYGDERGAGKDVLWAEFLDAKKLATCSRGGKLAIWNLATGQPICHFRASEAAIPSLSPDRKWIAFACTDSRGSVRRREKGIDRLANNASQASMARRGVQSLGA